MDLLKERETERKRERERRKKGSEEESCFSGARNHIHFFHRIYSPFPPGLRFRLRQRERKVE